MSGDDGAREPNSRKIRENENVGSSLNQNESD